VAVDGGGDAEACVRAECDHTLSSGDLRVEARALLLCATLFLCSTAWVTLAVNKRQLAGWAVVIDPEQNALSPRWNGLTCAALEEHLEVVTWAHRQGCCGMHGHVRTPLGACHCTCRSMRGSTPARGIRGPTGCKFAALGGHPGVFKLAREHRCPWDEQTVDLAVSVALAATSFAPQTWPHGHPATSFPGPPNRPQVRARPPTYTPDISRYAQGRCRWLPTTGAFALHSRNPVASVPLVHSQPHSPFPALPAGSTTATSSCARRL
jgi:hypothetical protein